MTVGLPFFLVIAAALFSIGGFGWQPVKDKPEHLTQLDAGHFAPKTHPRVEANGAIDELNATLGVARATATDDWLRGDQQCGGYHQLCSALIRSAAACI